MATLNVTQTTVYTLELSEYELGFLRCNLQNPLHAQAPEQESDEDSELRQSIWEGIS